MSKIELEKLRKTTKKEKSQGKNNFYDMLLDNGYLDREVNMKRERLRPWRETPEQLKACNYESSTDSDY